MSDTEINYTKKMIQGMIFVTIGLLIVLIIGEESYRDTIDKVNTGIYFTLIFLFGAVYDYYIEKFKKSENEINLMFTKYAEIFLIIQAEVIFIMGFYLMGTKFFGYEKAEKSIGYNLICFGITLFWYCIKKREIAKVKLEEENNQNDKKTEKGDKDQLFDSRKPQRDALIKLLEEDRDSSMILINGEWGIGKTFFVEKTLERSEVSKNIEKIFIDVMLFNSRKSLKDELFGEIESILEDNGIATKSIKEMNNYMDSIIESDNKWVNLALSFLKSKTFQKGKEGVEESIKKLEGKKIVVVIDNLERVLKKEDVIEIMGFLHEIQSIENISFVVCADKQKLKEMIEDDNYVEKFFLQEIELREIEIEDIVERICVEINYKDSIVKVIKEIFDDLLKREWNYTNLKRENDKFKNKEEYIKNIDEEYIKSGKVIAKIKKKIGNSRTIIKIIELIKQYNQTHRNIYMKEISEKRYLEILIRISIFRVILENEYKEILEEKEKKFKEVLIERKDINKKILEKSLDVIKEPIIISAIIKYYNLTEEKAYFRILEAVIEEDKIIDKIEKLNINEINKEEYFNLFENLSKYYRYLDINDISMKIYIKLRDKIFELEKEEYVRVLLLSEIAELEKRYNAGKKIEKSVYDRYLYFKKQGTDDVRIYFNFQNVYLKDFELFYKKFNAEKRKLLNNMGGTDFIIGISEQFKKSEEIKKIIEKIKGLAEKADRDAEIVKIKDIFMEEIEEIDVEGKEELKISISNFFYIFKKLITEGKEEKKVKKLLLSFKNKNYFEQNDLLNEIRKNENIKEYNDLNKEIINILPDVKVEFYNVLNIVKERAAKTENQ